MRTALLLLLVIALQGLACIAPSNCWADEPVPEGASSRDAKASAKRSIPFQRLNPNASELIRDVVDNPSFFRRMPSQEIECHPEMFTFLVRRPEVLVNIWELMGITQVSTKRTSPYSFLANDGVGTSAKCDLIYGDESIHVYYGTGMYDGTMTPRKMTGRCVCILQSRSAQHQNGENRVAGTMDVFLKLDNFGADLLTRTLGPLVSKTADYNFVETARFMSQISQICSNNPAAAQGLAEQLENVDGSVRQEFASIAAKIAAQSSPFPPTISFDATTLAPGGDAIVARKALPPEIDDTDSFPLQLTGSAPIQETLSDRPVTSRRPASDAPSRQLTADRAPQANAMQPAPAVRDAEPSLPPTAIWPRKPNIFMRR